MASDNFTCPSCGWPQGAIGTVDPPPHPCPSCGTLAAPQGQEKAARDAAEWYDFNRPTDAKEGEEDERNADNPKHSDGCGGDSDGVRPDRPVHTITPDIAEGEEDDKARTEIQTEGAIPASGVAEGDGRSATLTEDEEAVVRDAIRENNARARDEARRQGVTLHPKLTPDIAGLVDRLRGWDHQTYYADLMNEAADALERMAKINLAQSLQVAEKLDEFLAAKAEIARLRAALEKADEGLNFLHLYDPAALTGRGE